MNAASPTQKPGPRTPRVTLSDIEAGPPIYALAVVLVALLPEVERLVDDESAHPFERAAARRILRATQGHA